MVALPPDDPLRSDPRLTILHADMDAFFAAVEVLDDPSLAGKPLIIGSPGRRGVVSTASYEARRFGVHSALPSVVAKQRCPQGIWRPPRAHRYAELSRQIRDIFLDFTPEVQPLSLDEAFLDVRGSRRLFGGAVAIAESIRARVKEETGGLTVSVGVAENLFLAKLASDLEKPDGLTVLEPGRAPELLAPLPIERLWGVGRKSSEALRRLGIATIADVQNADEGFLARQLGERSAAHLTALAFGRDARRVHPETDAKSISTESTFAEDLHHREEIDRFLFSACENVAATLRRAGLRGRTVQLKVRTGSFQTMTRSVTLDSPTDLTEVLYESATQLFEDRVDLGREGVRLLGVGVQGLLDARAPSQGDLFAEETEPRARSTAKLLDEIQGSIGKGAVRRARLLRRPDDPERPGELDPSRLRLDRPGSAPLPPPSAPDSPPPDRS